MLVFSQQYAAIHDSVATKAGAPFAGFIARDINLTNRKA